MDKLLILFIIPIIFIIIFEFLGRAILSRLSKIKLQNYFPIGLVCFLGIIYPTSLLTNYNVSFYVLLIIYLIIFIVSIIFIIKYYSFIDHRINYVALLIACSICLLLSYYSYNTTLGNLNGFDTVHYLNMVSQNIGLSPLNSKDIYLNITPETVMTYYTNEVYYYFAGTILFFISKLFSVLKIDFYYNIAFIWIFQILYNYTLGSIIVEAYSRLNKKPYLIPIILLIVFVYGKLYFNNVYGFFGNSWYTLSLSYILLFILEYFDKENSDILNIIYLLLLGMCSFTSSGIYTSLFVLYGLFFFVKDDKCLRDFSIVMLIPLFNALFMEQKSIVICLLIPLTIMVICFIFGSKIFKIININNKNKIMFLFACNLVLFILSRFYSNGLFDFTGLLNNLSQRQDMTLNYFSYSGDKPIIFIYKAFILMLLALSIVFNYKKKYIQYYLILIFTIFNPFTCNFINRYISVYYRSYSIIFNPFMLMIMFNDLLLLANRNLAKNIISISLAILFILNIDFINPIIYHYQFEKDDNYNCFYKMSEDEISVIKELKNNIYYYNEDNPYIITGNLLTLSTLPQGKYLFGKSNVQSTKWTNAEKKLYSIFYTPEYLGDYIEKNPDYNNMLKYINEAKVDYVVVDKRVEYYEENTGDYSYLFYKVNDVCNIFPIYENDTYAIYHF